MRNACDGSAHMCVPPRIFYVWTPSARYAHPSAGKLPCDSHVHGDSSGMRRACMGSAARRTLAGAVESRLQHSTPAVATHVRDACLGEGMHSVQLQDRSTSNCITTTRVTLGRYPVRFLHSGAFIIWTCLLKSRLAIVSWSTGDLFEPHMHIIYAQKQIDYLVSVPPPRFKHLLH